MGVDEMIKEFLALSFFWAAMLVAYIVFSPIAETFQ